MIFTTYLSADLLEALTVIFVCAALNPGLLPQFCKFSSNNQLKLQILWKICFAVSKFKCWAAQIFAPPLLCTASPDPVTGLETTSNIARQKDHYSFVLIPSYQQYFNHLGASIIFQLLSVILNTRTNHHQHNIIAHHSLGNTSTTSCEISYCL